jgi:hypothetical protein
MTWEYSREPSKKIIDGEKYGRLTILHKSEKYRYWKCLCDCGKEKEVRQDAILNGDTLSCGCIAKEKAAQRAKEIFTKHGLSDSKIWATWKDMIRRCYAQNCNNYPNYGAKGVTVCDRWRGKAGFLNFVEDMGIPEHGDTLERVSVQGNYEPGNCKWESSLSVQGFNKRLKTTNTSGKTGVRRTSAGTWQAYINKDGKFYNLGSYKNFDDAVKARRDGEMKYYGFYQEDV